MKPINIFEHRDKFFEILKTTPLSQIAVQTIRPSESAGPPEKHPGDQVFYIIEGEAEVEVEGEKKFVAKPGDAFVVPKKTPHHIKSIGQESLFYFTVYAPPAY